jgi:hypothetical protein
VITCNNCRKQVSADATVCQFCGASLVAKEGTTPRPNDQEQPAIPAWLESLKASERPGTSASGSYSFSTADLVDEDALPGWMRPDSAELAKKSDSNKYPAVRPSWMSAPNTDATAPGGTSGPPTDRLSAGSLIDSGSLPSWMRPAPSSPSAPLSAASLVEPDSLPGWLSGPQNLSPNMQNIPNQTYQPAPPPAAPFQGQSVFNAPVPPYPAQASPAYSMNQAGLGGQQSQEQQATWQQSGSFSPLAQDANRGISASSLLDAQALPEWLRTGGAQSSPVPSASQPGQALANGLTPGSLIDMDALPDWLRSADAAPQSGYGSSIMQGNSGVYGSPGTPGALPRIENMRVPNRPRAEMAPMEQSEVAANVFSSMLGVASNASSYPAPNGNYAPAQQSFQAQPYQHSPEPRFAAPSAPFTQQSEMGAPGMQGYPGQTQAPAPALWGGQQAQPSHPSPQMYPAPDASGMGSIGNIGNGGSGGQAGQMDQASGGNAGLAQSGAAAGTKPAKRGFFETIREWFHI